MQFVDFLMESSSKASSQSPTIWGPADDDELAKLESLICLPGDTDTQLPMTNEGVFYFPGMDTHMIAAAE